jgi:hypothetical protein
MWQVGGSPHVTTDTGNSSKGVKPCLLLNGWRFAFTLEFREDEARCFAEHDVGKPGF